MNQYQQWRYYERRADQSLYMLFGAAGASLWYPKNSGPYSAGVGLAITGGFAFYSWRAHQTANKIRDEIMK